MDDNKADFEQDPSRVPLMEFKQYLGGYITRQLTAVGVPEQETEIVDIYFGLNNTKMTDKLIQRADALNSGDFDKLQVIQKEMTTIKNEDFQKLNTPNYMWITFKHDRAID